MENDLTKIAVTVEAMKRLLGRLYLLTYKQWQIPYSDVSEIHDLILKTWATAPSAEESDAPKLEVVSVEIMYELVSFLEQVEKDYIAMKQG
jgi:hypothetical protein